MTNKNVGQGYKFALLHNVSNAMGQYLECGNLIIFFCDIYWLNVRRGCTSKEKTIKKEAVKLGLYDFFLQTDFKLNLKLLWNRMRNKGIVSSVALPTVT